MKIGRNSNSKAPVRWGGAAVFTILILLTAAMIWAEGTQENKEQLSQSETAAQSAPAAVVGPDSVYVEINRGFLALEPIFKKGCYDCHSNKTEFPWYYKFPVIKGMIDKDIRQGRKHIDMSHGFPFATNVNVADDLVAIEDELKSGDMPPLMYRMMHWSAKPSDVEKDSIYQWITRSLNALAAKGIEPTNTGGDLEQ